MYLSEQTAKKKNIMGMTEIRMIMWMLGVSLRANCEEEEYTWRHWRLNENVQAAMAWTRGINDNATWVVMDEVSGGGDSSCQWTDDDRHNTMSAATSLLRGDPRNVLDRVKCRVIGRRKRNPPVPGTRP